MPVITDRFDDVKRAILSADQETQTRMHQAALQASRMIFQAIIAKQPRSEVDDRGLRPSWWQNRPAIEDAWGSSPIVTSSPGQEVISLQNVAPHVKFFVWSIGGIRQPYLGTKAHRIPTGGTALEAYGHPLVFWWKRMGRVERRATSVDHPGFTPTHSFVDEGWQEIEADVHQLFRQAAGDSIKAVFQRIW